MFLSNFSKLLLFYIGFPLLCQTIKVNMQGTFNLGSEVVDTLAKYVKYNFMDNQYNKQISRRSFDHKVEYIAPSVTNSISVIIKSETICSDISFCHDSMSPFVDRYLFALTEVIEMIFEDLIHDKSHSSNSAPKIFIFEGGLKKLLKEVKKLLLKANERIHENNERFVWVGLLKKLNILYQKKAMEFCTNRLEGTPEEIDSVKKKLHEKLIIATAIVELDFERKLCLEHKICLKKYYCTSSLHALFDKLTGIPIEKLKQFVRDFYESISDTHFFSHLNEGTANEFQFILHDMAYSDTVATKNVFETVKNTIGNRLEVLSTSIDKPAGRDVKLMHIILSDMDYFYSKHKYDPFDDFVTEIDHWTRAGGKIKNTIRKLMKDVTNEVANKSPEIVDKLINEVRIFMDLTVEPGAVS